MASLIVLLETKHYPIPPTVAVHEFGQEAVHCEGQFIHGTSTQVTADTQTLRDWLGTSGCWTSDNPMLGSWQFMQNYQGD